MTNTESSSIVVEWDKVDDSLPTNYTVTWTSNRTNSMHSHTLIEQLLYTITGLTVDTVYAVAVYAANRCVTGPQYRTNVSLSASNTTILKTTTASTTQNTAFTTTITSSSISTVNTIIIPSSSTVNSADTSTVDKTGMFSNKSIYYIYQL